MGSCSGSCVGYVWYDSRRQHVYEVVGEKLHMLTSDRNFSAKLLGFRVGGKRSNVTRPKAKCTAKCTETKKKQLAKSYCARLVAMGFGQVPGVDFFIHTRL